MTSSLRRFLVLPEGETSSEHKGLLARGIFTDIAETDGDSVRSRGAFAGADPLDDKLKAYETARERFQATRPRAIDHLIDSGFWHVEQYRVGTGKPSPGSPSGTKRRDSSKSADAQTPKTTRGTFGDIGHFVTIEGHPVFIRDSDGQINRGPRELKGRNAKDFPNAKSREKHRKTERSDKFTPKTNVDRAIVNAIGDHPDDVDAFRGYMEDAHKLLTTEHAETMDSMRNLLAHFGYSGRGASGFLSAVKKYRDHDNIRNFDEMAEFAKRYYPDLLAANTGSSTGEGDHEQALFQRLKDGFSPPPSKHSQEVVALATEMAGPNFLDTSDDKTAEQAKEAILVDPDDPFSDVVPFAASFHDQVIMRYHQLVDA